MSSSVPLITYPPPKDVWGPSYWVYLHTSASIYPKSPTRSDKLEAKEMVHSFIENVPCGKCREHARSYVKDNPPKLDSRKSFYMWTCDFHNQANKDQGKPTYECKLESEMKEAVEEVEGEERAKSVIPLTTNTRPGREHRRLSIDEERFGAIRQMERHKPEEIKKQAVRFPSYKDVGSASDWETRFPYLAKSKTQSMTTGTPTIGEGSTANTMAETPSEPGLTINFKGSTISILDPIFTLPASVTGVDPPVFNLAYTPTLIAGTASLLIESNLSTIGSAISHLVLGLGLFGVTILARPHLSYGDKLLLLNMSSAFLSNTISYANPKVKPKLIGEGMELIGEAQNGIGLNLLGSLVETPENTEAGGGPVYVSANNPNMLQPIMHASATTADIRQQQQASQRGYDARTPGAGGMVRTPGQQSRGERRQLRPVNYRANAFDRINVIGEVVNSNTVPAELEEGDVYGDNPIITRGEEYDF